MESIGKRFQGIIKRKVQLSNLTGEGLDVAGAGRGGRFGGVQARCNQGVAGQLLALHHLV